MPEETIEVPQSEDNGNVPAEAPIEEPKSDAPAEPVEPEQPAEPVQELFELPDGRKVDALTLSKEWKENFYPEYTRKSQELAQVKAPINKPETPQPTPDAEWQPETWDEVLRLSEQRAIQAIKADQQAAIDHQKSLEDAVTAQLESVKKLDPSVNENSLFLHATKYGFRDLTVAHKNMKDMSELAKTVQKTTANNIAKRNDPVSITPGATGARPDPSQFSTAVEYMRSLNK